MRCRLDGQQCTTSADATTTTTTVTMTSTVYQHYCYSYHMLLVLLLRSVYIIRRHARRPWCPNQAPRAPSATNTRPWFPYVILNAQLLKVSNEGCAAEVGPEFGGWVGAHCWGVV